jgi:hypothetical protein
MSKPGPTTQAKRNRERSRQERALEKQEKKAVRKEEQRRERDRLLEEGLDPDLAGIVPGPQPPQDELAGF